METQEAGQKKIGTQAGKRYKCVKCGTEVLITKPGSGALTCCGAEMQVK